jgi:hypothetical protein
MTVLPLALSLSNSFTKVGAIAAFAALLGIAIISLLAFTQAREIKRLREWAGRAPERAVELEQRAGVPVPMRSPGAGAAAPSGGAGSPVRVIPRKTPLVSAPVSTAVHATAATAVSANPPTAGAPSPSAPTGVAAGTVAAAGVAAAVPAPTQAPSGAPSLGGQPAPMPDSALPAGDVQKVQPAVEQPAITAPAPATAAARAADVAARPSLPPSPSAPAPPGAPAVPAVALDPPASAAQSSSVPSSSAPRDGVAPVRTPPPSAPRPPAPAAPVPAVAASAQRTPSRAVGASAAGTPPRSPTPPRATTAAGASVSPGGVPAGGDGPKYFKAERSPVRATAMIVGGVIALALLVVVAFSVLKGGGSSATATHGTPPVRSHSAAVQSTVANPAELAVTVLNGTETNGLAHHLASALQQSGYARAEASSTVPPGGAHASTVVEYTSGHRADGQSVARTLKVTDVQPIEGAISALAGSAAVVVVAGADQAALFVPASQSNGEPAAGAEAAGGNAPGGGEAPGGGSAEAPTGAAEAGTG